MASGRIVVGVDGSLESVRALSWAVEEAELRGDTVEVVYAYDHDPAWAVTPVGTGPVPLSAPPNVEERARDAAMERIDEAVDKADARKGSVEIVRRPVADPNPARALVEASENADLLVVASRGTGAFMGLLLGSVSQKCAQLAQCPLVILPHPEGED